MKSFRSCYKPYGDMTQLGSRECCTKSMQNLYNTHKLKTKKVLKHLNSECCGRFVDLTRVCHSFDSDKKT